MRRYIARLPDFEDEDALLAAHARVPDFPDVVTALGFCLSWPDPALAARLVLSRADDLDDDAYEILTPAAEMLAPEHPLATVLVRRAMILFALEKARSGLYGHAARHLASCAQAEAAIADHAGHPDHQAFVAALRQAHGGKSAFRSRVGEGPVEAGRRGRITAGPRTRSLGERTVRAPVIRQINRVDRYHQFLYFWNVEGCLTTELYLAAFI